MLFRLHDLYLKTDVEGSTETFVKTKPQRLDVIVTHLIHDSVRLAALFVKLIALNLQILRNTLEYSSIILLTKLNLLPKWRCIRMIKSSCFKTCVIFAAVLLLWWENAVKNLASV
jgi:hypothetical protein